MADYKQRLAARVVEAREAKGWSQRELAFRADVSDRQLGRIETAKSEPRLSTIRKLAETLGVEVSQIRPDPEAEERDLHEQLNRIEEKLDELLSGRSAEQVEGSVAAAGRASRASRAGSSRAPGATGKKRADG